MIPITLNSTDHWPLTTDNCSLCVAAPAYDANDRYRPFNSKRDPASAIIERQAKLLQAAASRLSANGLMFVYGLPFHLPRYAAVLSDDLVFRYWIAIRAMTSQKPDGLRPEHMGLLLLSKPGASLNRIRIPHPQCRSCGETLKDWGGKSHLMHPEGVALSDVWRDMVVDSEDRMPREVLERILQLSTAKDRDRLLLLIPDKQSSAQAFQHNHELGISAFNPLEWNGHSKTKGRKIPEGLMNRLHNAQCLDVLRSVPSGTIDLAFADPPFNLTKDYNQCSDDRRDRDYVGWCKRWLVEYERVLKPGGAMFILNLPKWSVTLADFLSRSKEMFFQNWIVWDSLPEPKGVLMPAHYSLLYFTKGPAPARFNYCSMEHGWQPFEEAVFPPDRADVCQRRRCVRRRRASGKTWRGELTDIWYDIHRVRQRARPANTPKLHPCATPARLIDRIIRLTTNPGDLVLDGFAGIGTTPFVARRLGRHFIAIEVDYKYSSAAKCRMSDEQAWPSRQARAKRNQVSKRRLQMELRRLALMLGRLPTKADVELSSRYELQVFEKAFDSWSIALKAAKLEIAGLNRQAFDQEQHSCEQLEVFETTQNLYSRSDDESPSLDYQTS